MILSRFLPLIAVAVLLNGSTFAQDLPSSPAQWINSPPLTKEMLKGKAAVFYFVEEECPNCAKRWPAVLTSAAKFQGQPVMFVAVNSGNSRPDFEDYLRRNNVPWPALCDWDRSFEKQFGFEISLDNIAQVEMLKPDGGWDTGSFNDIEGSAKRVAAAAQWKIDPQSIPDSLRDAWRAIEFGAYPDAARQVTKNLEGKGPAGQAAQLLNKYVIDDMTARIDQAQKSLDEGKSWEAYKGFSAIPMQFKGYQIPEDLAGKIAQLAKTEAVKDEQAAQKLLLKAQTTASKGPGSLKTAVKQLQSLVKSYPETEAGIQAQVFLDQLDTDGKPQPATR